MMPSVVKSRRHTCSVLDAFTKNTPDVKGCWAFVLSVAGCSVATMSLSLSWIGTFGHPG